MPRKPGQFQLLQQLGDSLIGIDDAVTEAHQLQVLGDGQRGEEGLLPQVGGEPGALRARARVRNVPEHPDLTLQRLQQPAAGAQDRRLAGPVDPDQRQHLAGKQVEGRRGADRLVTVSDAEVAGTHQRLTTSRRGLGAAGGGCGPDHGTHLTVGGFMPVSGC